MNPSATALREALTFLQGARHAFDGAEDEPPFFLATNLLITEIARREGRQLGEVIAEVGDRDA